MLFSFVHLLFPFCFSFLFSLVYGVPHLVGLCPFSLHLKKKSYVNAYRYWFHENKRKEQKFKGTVQQYGNMSSSAPAMGRAAVCSVWCHEVQACLVISCVVSCHCMALQTWS